MYKLDKGNTIPFISIILESIKTTKNNIEKKNVNKLSRK